MPTHKLLLPAGRRHRSRGFGGGREGAGLLGANGTARFEIEHGLVGGCAIDAYGVPVSDADVAPGGRGRCGAARRRRRPGLGRRRLRDPSRGGPASPPQGPRPLRQPAPRHLPRRAGRRVLAEARARRRTRHPHRPRTDRRRLFRRAEADHRPRQWPEARHRHPGLRHLRDRAHRPRGVRAGAQADRSGHLLGEAQRHEVPACSGTRP